MAQNKLTIAIGTYNRPNYIQRQVRDILSQLEDGVSLVVFDNCSDIPVSSLFTEDELPLFKIIRNKVNIGRDQNQVRCIEFVDEGWVWTLSDDDKLKPNAIKSAISLVCNHSDCCYINTGNKKIATLSSFHELADYFKTIGTFGISFFQSECLYNMDKLSTYIQYFNEFLSSQIGQICMVMKYMELNHGEKCFMWNGGLVCDIQPGGWDPLKFIKNSSILLDKFDYQHKILKTSLFKAIADMHLSTIIGSRVSYKQKVCSLIFVIHRHGLINILRYNYLLFGGVLMDIVLPQKIFSYIKNLISNNYNTTHKY